MESLNNSVQDVDEVIFRLQVQIQNIKIKELHQVLEFKLRASRVLLFLVLRLSGQNM